jgi:A118 family predicted phage portal protein
MIRGVKSMFSPTNNLRKTVSSQFVKNGVTSQTIIAQQQLWKSVYMNQAPWLIPNKVVSVGLAAIVSGEVARLVTLDMRAQAVGSDAVNAALQSEVMWNLRTQVEYGLALGGMIVKPYRSHGRVQVRFLQPDEYEILSVDTDNTVLDCVFKDFEQVGEDFYVRLERHVFHRATSTYTVTNEFFKNSIESAIDFSFATRTVARWADTLPEQVLSNVTQPLFGVFKPATANTVDTHSPHGVSVFDKALPAIELADKQLSGMVREFKIKEGRLYIDEMALDSKDISQRYSIPNLQDDFYIKLATDAAVTGTTFFEVFSPDIRVEAYLRAFNKYQQLVEDNIGLMHGTFSSPDVTDRTATEVRESKHRTYSTVNANQRALDRTLNAVLYTIAYYLGIPTGSVWLKTHYDDSLINDPKEALESIFEDVSAGLVRPEVYLARKYGMTEEEALNLMPKGTQLLRPSNTSLVWAPGDLAFGGDGGSE